MFYDNFRAACERKGTTLTAVLREIGRASGNTGTWKDGRFPKLDAAMEIAEYLQISIDELVYGLGHSSTDKAHSGEFSIDSEWVDIISHIPEDKQQMCKDFLRTHMVIPDKYSDKKEA
ncbi:MAG: hypothetical protein Q4B26_14020 [Eubacteriales bacterium]|nr:hypothetical protein [Eubacteriales bacterium]